MSALAYPDPSGSDRIAVYASVDGLTTASYPVPANWSAPATRLSATGVTMSLVAVLRDVEQQCEAITAKTDARNAAQWARADRYAGWEAQP